ncbi:hypothetical protein BH11ACT8_BH11ACT8_31780 [soil metagenome]
MQPLVDLSRPECEDLLRAGVAGRIAFSTPDGPHIVPVNYAVVDDAIVVRTSPYSLLGTYGRDAQLAFEVDLLDHAGERGWSVLVRGRARAVTDPSFIARVRARWPQLPWASGTRTLLLRLSWTDVTGRRLGSGWDDGAEVAGAPDPRDGTFDPGP